MMATSNAESLTEPGTCPTCFHDRHEGLCPDADDLGLPWYRPCDCETHRQ